MLHRLLSILMWLAMAITASAQGNILTKEANLLCDSDEMILRAIPYFYTNESGEDITWNFSILDAEGKYKIDHYIDSMGRILALTDHDITYYKERTDTLYIIGYEAPLYKTNFVSPQLAMSYPFVYGDSVSHLYVDSTDYYPFGTSYANVGKSPSFQKFRLVFPFILLFKITV